MSTVPAHLASLIQNWNRVHKQSVRLMAGAPSDQFEWKTCDSAMTLGALMNHIYQAEAGLVNAAITGQFSGEGAPPATATDELIEAFEKSHAELLDRVAALTPEQLAEQIEPFGEKVGKMTRADILHITLEHEVHHRGQLYVYLRMLGVAVPPLYGGV
ncbi:MAG: DinB family protein [Acidobacteria bacterium]|nr:DinB family protein [Acidobacteriota bacterium]MCW5969572.1 DinB family protein [Blastocatellales bacterium]